MASTYTLSMVNLTVAADATLLYLRAATAVTSRASLLEVLRISITQQGTSVSQQLGIILGQKAAVLGTYLTAGGGINNHALGGPASGIALGTAGAAATAGVNASSEGAGTVTTWISEGFNNLSGYLWVPTPEERFLVLPDQNFIVKLRGTPTTLTGWNANLTFRELN